MVKTKEPQYQTMTERPIEPLGLMTSYAWGDDPKRLAFTLSRYKFVAKLLSGCENVLEVGCADAFGTRVVKQEVEHLMAVDFDPVFIDDVIKRMNPRWSFSAVVYDMLSGPILNEFDAAYTLDVLEHIDPEMEHLFLSNMVRSLGPNGILIIGTPSLEAQPYASPNSKAGHINCKSLPQLKTTLQRYFHNVFMFCMNDEVIHTGFHKMANYLFAVGSTKKDNP